MRLVYDAVYLTLVTLVTPWLVWQSLRTGKYREGFWEKLWGRVPARSGTAPCLWLHAVSVGEVNLLVELVERWKQRHPEFEIIVTTTTQTGYRLAQQRFAEHLVAYAPLDFSWAVRRALKRWRPEALVLAELELWPNLIREARRQGVAVAVVNGRLSENSFRGYRRIRRLVRGWLAQINWLGAQNEEYAARFRRLGFPPERLDVTGSLKFDRAEFERERPAVQRLRRDFGITADDRIWVAGSTQDPEESLVLARFAELSRQWPALRLVLVPRHAERFDDVCEQVHRSGLPWVRRSRCQSGEPVAGWKVLVVDTIGELGAWWGTATIAFVGGSLGSRGGQNMIEPAAYGAAVCFGPNTRNFREVVEQLLACDGAEVVEDDASLARFVERCLADPTWAQQLGRRAQRMIKQQQGATAATIQGLETMLELDASSPVVAVPAVDQPQAA